MAERRRGRGEGSIYRRKDGRSVGQYEVVGKRRYVYGKTRKEVAGKLARAVADGNDGLIFDSDNLTFAQYLDRWLYSIRGTVRESTWVRHEINVRVHLKPVLGRARLDKLKPLEIQSFYRRKLNEGQSAASVLKMHSTVSKSLKQAVRWRLIPLNVCVAVMPPRPMKPEIQPLDVRQMIPTGRKHASGTPPKPASAAGRGAGFGPPGRSRRLSKPFSSSWTGCLPER